MSDVIIIKKALDDYERLLPSKNFPHMPILYLEFLENKTKVRKEYINKNYTPALTSQIPKKNNEVTSTSDPPSATITDLDENEDTVPDHEKIIENQLQSLLGEETPEAGDKTPPTLEELQQKKKITISRDYRYAEEEDEETQKDRNAVYFKYEVLRRMHPNAHIPEFTIYSDPKLMSQKYELLTKKLSLETSVDNWKRYMIVFVMGCEVVLGKLSFDMEGFAQQQIMSMSTYDQLLVEMAEKSYIPSGSSKWSPEVRLCMMLTMNIVLFVISKMIFKKTGTNLLGTINDLTTPGQRNFTDGQERKMKEPSSD